MDKSTHEKLLGYVVLALFSGTLFYLASSSGSAGVESTVTPPSTVKSVGQSQVPPQEFAQKPSVSPSYETSHVQKLVVKPQIAAQPIKASMDKVSSDEAAVQRSEVTAQPAPLRSHQERAPKPEKAQAAFSPEKNHVTAISQSAKREQAAAKPQSVQQKRVVRQRETPKSLKAAGHWSVQLGAFSTESAAKSFQNQLTGIGLKDVLMSIKQNPHRYIVTVGQFASVDDARKYKLVLEADNIDGFIVKT